MFPISRYLNVRMAFAPALTANGRYLSFITDITGNTEAWQLPLPTATQTATWPRQLTFNGDRVLSITHSPTVDDNRLIYSCDVGGNEKAQLFLLDPSTGTERCLTTGYEDCMHTPGQWSKDGRFILFAANRRHPAYFDLYQQPLDGSPAQLIWQNDQLGYLSEQRLSPDGSTIIVSRTASSYYHELLAIDVASGNSRTLNPADAIARYSHVHFNPDGRSLTLLTNLNNNFMHITQLDLDTLTWTPRLSFEWDVEKMTISPCGTHLSYIINEAGNSQLYHLNTKTNVTTPAPIPNDIPKVVSSHWDQLTTSADGRWLAFALSYATKNFDIALWDIEQNKLSIVTQSSNGGIPLQAFIPPQLIHYPTFDERDIPAWYYPPSQPSQQSKNGRFPVVVIVHGGPEGQFRPNFNFLVQYLCQHGYGVLAPNVRGSVGYGKIYSDLDNVEKRMDSVADLAHAAHWLTAQPNVDPDRIVVYGGSYGGFMVLAALTHYPDLWAAGVNIVGISNFVTFLENTSDYRRAHREAEYGTLAHDRDFLNSIAPINHLDNVKAPLFVIHGANDPRVPLSEAEQLVAALETRNVPVQSLIFDDEGHGVVKLKNKRVMYPQVIAFLEQHLQ